MMPWVSISIKQLNSTVDPRLGKSRSPGRQIHAPFGATDERGRPGTHSLHATKIFHIIHIHYNRYRRYNRRNRYNRYRAALPRIQ